MCEVIQVLSCDVQDLLNLRSLRSQSTKVAVLSPNNCYTFICITDAFFILFF